MDFRSTIKEVHPEFYRGLYPDVILGLLRRWNRAGVTTQEKAWQFLQMTSKPMQWAIAQQDKIRARHDKHVAARKTNLRTYICVDRRDGSVCLKRMDQNQVFKI